MALRRTIDRDRLWSGVLTAAAVTALGYALVSGLAVTLPIKPADVMKLFALPLPRPPEPREKPPPPHPHRAQREGAAAPPNKRSKATPVAVPPPIVPPIQPPPLVAATIPAIGLNATSGAAPVAGPGSGAGGRGNGTGSGRSGNGGGDGGTPAHLITDTLRTRDLPQSVARAALPPGRHLVVYMRFTVNVDGRVTDCAVTRSSGDPALDAATCAATIRKLRYRPELDGAGRPVPVTFVGAQEWSGNSGPPSEGRDPDDD